MSISYQPRPKVQHWLSARHHKRRPIWIRGQWKEL